MKLLHDSPVLSMLPPPDMPSWGWAAPCGPHSWSTGTAEELEPQEQFLGASVPPCNSCPFPWPFQICIAVPGSTNHNLVLVSAWHIQNEQFKHRRMALRSLKKRKVIQFCLNLKSILVWQLPECYLHLMWLKDHVTSPVLLSSLHSSWEEPFTGRKTEIKCPQLSGPNQGLKATKGLLLKSLPLSGTYLRGWGYTEWWVQ